MDKTEFFARACANPQQNMWLRLSCVGSRLRSRTLENAVRAWCKLANVEIVCERRTPYDFLQTKLTFSVRGPAAKLYTLNEFIDEFELLEKMG